MHLISILLTVFIFLIPNSNILYKIKSPENCCFAKLNQIETIGKDLNLGYEYIFRYPQQVQTDDEGFIFISDRNSSSIKIFDQSFNFFKSIGAKGQGPGEFQEITRFIIDDQNNLIIFDNLSQRFTIFYKNSEYLNFTSFLVDTDFGSFNVSNIIPYKNKIIVGVLNNNISNGKNLNFIKIQGDQIRENFQIAGSEIADTNEPFEHATLAMSLFNIELIDNNLWLSPTYYNGTLYKFDLETDLITKYVGHSPSLPPFVYVSDDYIRRQRNNMSVYNGVAGRFITKIYNRSVGLFHHDDEIIEFVFTDENPSLNKNNINFGVNRYSLEGRFINFHIIEEFSSDPSGRFFLDVLWRDDQGRFYVLDTKDIPYIRIMELELSSEN